MGSPRTGIRKLLSTAVGVMATLLLAAPAAQAFTAPEVFLKEIDPSNMPIGDWIPMAGATMHSVNRWEVGVRIQDTGQPGNSQRILLQVNSVPGGAAPTQPDVYAICLPVTGTAGEIVGIQEDLRYQGDGPYSITVTVSADTGDASHGCAVGAATTSSFTASAPTTARFLGHMVEDPATAGPFNGIEVFPALGAGGSDIQCARDPRPAADGTLTGSLTLTQGGDGNPPTHFTIQAADMFTQPGRYACVARSIGGGEVPGPWSAPTATEIVQIGFKTESGSWRLSTGHGPVFKLTGGVSSPLAAGGKLKVAIQGLGRHTRTLRQSTRVRAGGKVSLRFRVPGTTASSLSPSFVMGFAFGGTKFVAARPAFAAFEFRLSEFPGGNRLEFTGSCGPSRC